jgi:type I restriction enzyme, S subunit
MSELPESWLLTKFTDVFDIQGGTQPPKNVFKYEPQSGYIQLLQIRDFGERPVSTYIPDTDTLKKCTEQDILIARYGASLGRILTGLSGAYNVAMAKVDIPDSIYKRFAYHLLRTEIFQAPLHLVSRSAQSGFNKLDLEKIELPIAPFNRPVAL